MTLVSLLSLDLLDELDFFKDHGIGVINASPAGSGLLRRNDIPPWHVAPPLLKEAAIKAAEYCHERGINIGNAHFKLQHFAVGSIKCYDIVDFSNTLGKMVCGRKCLAQRRASDSCRSRQVSARLEEEEKEEGNGPMDLRQ